MSSPKKSDEDGGGRDESRTAAETVRERQAAESRRPPVQVKSNGLRVKAAPVRETFPETS
jgi:hypothetical protein